MGFEKQTFLFHCLSDATTLFCVLVFPSLLGAHAYMLGLALSFTLHSVCNLVLLTKHFPDLFKARGQVCVEPAFRRLFRALLAILPLSILGQGMLTLFTRSFGETLALLLTAVALGLCSVSVYLLFKILPVKKKPRALYSHKKCEEK